MAALPDGALMQRAATGLAVAIADLLGSGVRRAGAAARRRRGQRRRRAVGRGDAGAAGCGGRGGAALREGARRRAGRAAGRAAAASVAAGRRAPARRGGRRDRRHRRAAGAAPEAEAALARVPRACRWSPSTCPPGSTSTPAHPDGAHVRADLTVTFGTHKVAHLVDPAAAGVRRGPPRRPRARPARGRRSRRCSRSTWRRCCRVPGPFDHKYTRGVVGVRAGSAAYPGAAVLCTSGAVLGLAGHGALPRLGRRRRPRPAPRGRGLRRPGAGLGRRLRRRRRRRAGARRRPRRRGADGGRRRRARSTYAAGRARPRADPARRRAGPDARASSAREVEADQLGFARRAAAEYDAVVLLKGAAHARRPAGRTRCA